MFDKSAIARESTRQYDPVFKFLKQEYADSMLAGGNFRVPRLRTFRNASEYEGLIHDPKEGKVEITNTYKSYYGLAKNADGLLPWIVPAYEVVNVENEPVTRLLDVDTVHAYAYCITKYFLSESLFWAMNEKGKEACVMIVDVMEFIQRIVGPLKTRGLFRPIINDCKYDLCDEDRRIDEIDPNPKSITNKILTDERSVAFLKPPRYSAQMESRIVWWGESEAIPEYVDLNVPEICDLLIPIRFDGIKKELLSDRSSGQEITCRVNTKDGANPLSYTVRYPSEIFRPVVDQHPGETEPHIGFQPQSRVIDGMTIRGNGGGTGMTFGDDGSRIIRHRMSNISSINFLHGPE